MEECKAYTVYNPMIFANLIIDYSFTDKNYLTANKLNALVYLSTIESMKTRESTQPLFAENFMVYNFGAVLKSVNDYFTRGSLSLNNFPIKKYVISHYGKDGMGESFLYGYSTQNHDIDSAISATWSRFSNYSFEDLAKIIRQPYGAWDKNFQNNSPFISWEDIVIDSLTLL